MNGATHPGLIIRPEPVYYFGDEYEGGWIRFYPLKRKEAQ